MILLMMMIIKIRSAIANISCGRPRRGMIASTSIHPGSRHGRSDGIRETRNGAHGSFRSNGGFRRMKWSSKGIFFGWSRHEQGLLLLLLLDIMNEVGGHSSWCLNGETSGLKGRSIILLLSSSSLRGIEVGIRLLIELMKRWRHGSSTLLVDSIPSSLW